MNGNPILGQQIEVSVSALADGASTVFVATAGGRAIGIARVTCSDAQIMAVLANAMAQAAAQAMRGLVAAPAGLAELFKT